MADYSYAVKNDSVIPKQLTIAQLQQIYLCNPAYVGTGPDYSINPLLPTEGSPARTAWESAMGITDTQITSGQLPCVQDGALRIPVVADDGRQLITPRQLMPYSIDVFDRQTSQQITDIHGDAVLGTVNGTLPQISNPAFPVTRELYNVVPTTRILTDPYRAVFVGANSLICQNTATILQYGFATVPDCGATSNVTAP